MVNYWRFRSSGEKSAKKRSRQALWIFSQQKDTRSGKVFLECVKNDGKASKKCAEGAGIVPPPSPILRLCLNETHARRLRKVTNTAILRGAIAILFQMIEKQCVSKDPQSPNEPFLFDRDCGKNGLTIYQNLFYSYGRLLLTSQDLNSPLFWGYIDLRP